MALGQVVIVSSMLVTAVALIFGALFVVSEEFVVATVDCNTDTNPYGVDDCVDNKVVDSEGKVCQVGRLGLYTSAFTPECTYGGEYEISALIAPFEGETLDFPPLFAAQTNLAGALPTLTASEGVEFTTCEEFFANPLVVGGLGVATTLGLQGGFETLAQNIKDGYDEGIDSFVGLLDQSLYAGAHLTLIDNWNRLVDASGVDPLPTTTTDLYDVTAFGCGTVAVQAAVNCVAAAVAGNPLAAPTAVAIQTGLVLGLLTDAAETNVPTLMAYGVASGSGSLTLSGIPEEGLWSDFTSTMLCGAGCTSHYDYIVNSRQSVDDAINFAGRTDLIPLLGQLDLLIATIQGYLLQASATIHGVNAATMNEDANILVNFVLNGTYALEQTTNGTNVPLALASNFYNFFLTKSVFVSNSKNALQASTIIPTTMNTPAGAEPGLEAWGLVCAVQGLPGACSLQQFINASLYLETVAASPDPRTLESLGLVDLVLTVCNLAGQNNVDACVASYGTGGSFAATPVALTGETLVDVTTETVLSAFYPLETNAASGQSAMLTEAATLCEDDEKDRAAIALAQVLVPAGMGLLGAGLILSAINLFVVKNKIAGAVAGVISIVGAGLILGGLLAVYNAPIYASVGGGSGTPEDNDTVYASGIALTYALVLIGAGFIGGFAALAGGVLLKKEDESVAILGKA